MCLISVITSPLLPWSYNALSTVTATDTALLTRHRLRHTYPGTHTVNSNNLIINACLITTFVQNSNPKPCFREFAVSKWKCIFKMTLDCEICCSDVVFQKMADDRTGSVRDVCIDWSIDHWLTDTNRYQLTNFIDWYRLIDWFSDHRFPSVGCPGHI